MLRRDMFCFLGGFYVAFKKTDGRTYFILGVFRYLASITDRDARSILFRLVGLVLLRRRTTYLQSSTVRRRTRFSILELSSRSLSLSLSLSFRKRTAEHASKEARQKYPITKKTFSRFRVRRSVREEFE